MATNFVLKLTFNPCAAGITYCKPCISRHLAQRATCPATNLPLGGDVPAVVNYAVKSIVEKRRQQLGLPPISEEDEVRCRAAGWWCLLGFAEALSFAVFRDASVLTMLRYCCCVCTMCRVCEARHNEALC